MATSLQVTAAGWLLLSLGHTSTVKDWQHNDKFQTLPKLAYTSAKAGWYQGSAFFILNALVNYGWSKNPALLNDPVQKAIAGLMVGIVWVSAGYYIKRGANPNAVATTLIGALQLYSGFA